MRDCYLHQQLELRLERSLLLVECFNIKTHNHPRLLFYNFLLLHRVHESNENVWVHFWSGSNPFWQDFQQWIQFSEPSTLVAFHQYNQPKHALQSPLPFLLPLPPANPHIRFSIICLEYRFSNTTSITIISKQYLYPFAITHLEWLPLEHCLPLLTTILPPERRTSHWLFFFFLLSIVRTILETTPAAPWHVLPAR